MGVGGIFVTLRAFTDKFRVDMKKAGAAVKRFSTSTVNINRQLKKVGKTMSKVGRQMSTSFSLPIVAAGGLAVKTFADFEQSMAKVAAVSGATGAEFQKLEQLAKDLGASTRFTAAQVAELELNYSKLGFVPAEIEKITKPTLDLALATGEDLAESAEVAGSTLRGLGLAAADMPRVVDVMAKSFSISALDLESFRESMKLVAPTAVATGRDLETVTAQLAVLAKNGIKGSIAGTQLNRVFIELNKKGMSLEEALDKVSNSSNGLATATGLVKDRGAKALLILAKQRKELGPLEQKLRNAGGAAADMAAIMDDTLQGAMLRVKSAVEGAAIELGNTLAPVIKKVGEFIANLANKFSALSPKTKKIITVVAGLVAAIGPLLVVLGFLTSTVLPALITGFTVLMGPIGLAVAAITAIGAAAFITYQHFNRVESAQSALNDTMDDAARSVASEVAEIDKLIKIASSENLSRERRAAAVQELQDKYPDYLKNLDLESIKSGTAKISIDKLKSSILKMAEARAINADLQQIEVEKLEIATAAAGDNLTIWDEITLSLKAVANMGDVTSTVMEAYALDMERAAEKTAALTARSDLLIEKLGELDKQAPPITTDDPIIPAAPGGIGGIGDTGDTASLISANSQAFFKWAQKVLKGSKKVIDSITPLKDELNWALFAARDFSAAWDESPIEVLERQRAVLKSYIAQTSEGGKIITEDIRKQIAEYDKLGFAIEKIAAKKEQLAALSDFLKGGFKDAFISAGEGIGEALGGGGTALDAFKGFAKSILGMIKQLGAAMIAIGLGMEVAIITAPEGIKTVIAGVAMIAAATAGMAMFAKGGLVFGETLGIVGEGRGTTRSNPEVIAPLDKLQGMLGGGGKGGVTEFVLRGETLGIVGEGRGTTRSNPEVIAPLDKLQGMLGGGGRGGVTEFVLRGETLRAITNKVADNRSFTIRE